MPGHPTVPRIVVLGGGAAGLTAAAAACTRGAAVAVVDATGSSDGVARGQLHNLVTRGQRAFEEVLPGFRLALLGAGAEVGSVSLATHVFELGVEMPRRDLGLELWSAPKALVVDTLAAMVRASGEIRWVRDRVVGLAGRADQVSGVRLAATGLLEADLVIDALGAGSPVTRHLAAIGAPTAPVTAFEARQWYISTSWERSPRPDEDTTFWLQFGTDDVPRTALVSPLNERYWKVSVSGPMGESPPRNHEEVLLHVASLPDPAVHELLANGQGAGPLDVYTKQVSRWRRYEQVATPAGLVSIGDAAFSPNPIFGQGLSLAAWQASLLGPLIEDPSDPATTHATRDDLARACATGWELMTVMTPDSTATTDPSDWTSVADLVARDPESHRRYVEIWHLLRPTSTVAELVSSASHHRGEPR